MDKSPLSHATIDKQAYALADQHFARATEVLAPEAVETLAQEVVRRLAFRMPAKNKTEGMPSPQDIERLCQALLSTEEVAGDRIILSARRDGVSADEIYLGYVAGAARHLGEMWVADQVTFAEVTVATSRLYRIMRGLRHVLDSARGPDAKSRHVLFALVPDDSHTLGIVMATDLFRRDGWDVELSIGESHDDIMNRSERERFQSVVLVANSDGSLPQLLALVLALRITQPMAHIVVAGNIVDQHVNISEIVGADDMISDVSTAIERLRAIIATDG